MSYYEYEKTAKFSEIKGKRIKAIKGLEVGSDRVTFEFEDGSEYAMYHSQDCCESVDINEIVGDVEDLRGKLMEAEEVSSADAPAPEYAESYTWTFYKLRTSKGCVVIRWLGQSNGYYSESVDFVRTKDADSVKETA